MSRTGLYFVLCQGILLLAFGVECALADVPTSSARESVPQAWWENVEEIERSHKKSVELMKAGRYTDAISLSQRALELMEQSLGPAHPLVTIEMGYLGTLYHVIGAFSEAETLYLRALAIQEKSVGPEHPELALTMAGLASVYYRMGQFMKAEALLQQALAIQEKAVGPEHQAVATIVTMLASIYLAIRDYAQAERLLKRALWIDEKALGPGDPGVAGLLNNLGELYRTMGEYAKAEPLYLRALAIEEKASGPEHPSVAKTLNNLGLLYRAIGESEKAKPLLERALAITEKTLGNEHPNAGTILNNLGNLYLARGEYAKAEPLYLRSLAVREKAFGDEHSDVAQTLDNMAFLAAAQRDFQAALNLFKKTHAIQERLIRDIFAFTTEGQKLQFVQSIAGDYVVLSLIHQYLNAEQEAVRSGLAFVLRRKGIVFDAQSRAREALQGRMSAATRKEWDQLSALRGDLARLVLNKPEKMSLEVYRARLASLQQQIETVEQRLAGESALVAKELKQRNISVEAAARALPEHSALVEFVKIQDYDFAKREWSPIWRYMAFVLTSVGDVTLVDLGEAGMLEATARRVLTDIRVSLDSRGFQVLKKPHDVDHQQQSFKSLFGLYSQLWGPLEKSLKGVDKVVVSPDALLNLVPFAALIDGDRRSLLERYQLTYVSSGRALIGLAGAQIQPSSDLLLVANPAFGKKAQGSGNAVVSVRSRDFRGVFDPLPGTEREAKEIPPLVSGKEEQKRVLEGMGATEDAVKFARSPRILHLATHGFFLQDEEIDLCGDVRGVTIVKNEMHEEKALCEKRRGVAVVKKEKPASAKQYENPLVRSGLAFAGANKASEITEGDDGILTALEITGMDLYGTELVVLSACETGVGEVQNGEGVFGLRRAFALAGAKNLMMSLWPVSDEITAKQMNAFYLNLQTMPPAEALRQAQLETIKELNTKEGIASPALWAPFILQGVPVLGP